MIYITGSTGMVGKNLTKQLDDNTIGYRALDYYTLFKNNFDPSKISATMNSVWGEHKPPHTLIHLAANVGGIFKNKTQPFSMFNDNIRITNSMIELAINRGYKFIGISSVCCYPKEVPDYMYPMVEEDMFIGPPEPTNAGYAEAKRATHKALDFAKQQYKDFKFLNIICGNLYGPGDHFFSKENHVIPALIEKFHRAAETCQPEVVLYGDGTPMRQFTYVKDFANFLKNRAVKDDLHGHYNYANPNEVSIKTLADVIASVVGYKGEIKFNGETTGQKRRTVSIQKLQNDIDLNVFTDLYEGISETYGYFLEVNERECNYG